MLGLFALQLDKGNIAYAATTSFASDIGITADQVGYGNQLMQAGIVIGEVPFNMVLSRIGPALWLVIQIFTWGTIATAQTALSNQAGFYATRFLLGIWEAGYLAASLTILSWYYTRREMAMRVTLVYIGNYFSSGVGGLLAAAIFKIPESSGLKRWQVSSFWLFLIDGIFTLLVGVVFIFAMPKSTKDTSTLVNMKKFDFWNDRERHIMDNRVLLDDPRKTVRLSGIGFRRVLTILTDHHIWGHCVINIISLAPKGGLGYYGPVIVKSFGFDPIQASALNSVSNFGVCILALGCAWISDRVSFRGPLCLAAAMYSITFAAAQFGIVKSSDVWLKYAIFTLLSSGNAVAQSINDAWMSVNTHDPQVRCVGMALAVAGSNLGGLAGINLFKQSDAPRYARGFLGVLCLYGGSIVVILVMMALYWYENKRMAKRTGGEQVVDSKGVDVVRGDGSQAVVKNQL
ncbi:major facilitator superfamily protein [Sarocladium implicatum]|nr:major facilitator superfamily protein [Sarocladium implicatum]